jgi:hypothetical protein
VSRVLAFTGQGIMNQSRYIKWDLLERKEKLQLEKYSGARKPVACCSGEGWGFYGRSNSGLGGFFSLAVDSWAFSGELVWFAPLLGEGKNLESILLISPMADLSDPVSLFRMQKCSLQLPLRMQECRPLTPQDARIILLSIGDGILTHLP